MERFEHLSMVTFLILGLALVKLMTSYGSLFARNVIAHVQDPNEIFRGASNLLSLNGVFVVEVPHLLNIIKHNQYDNQH